MASTSSLGNASLANASSAQSFYTHFRAATWKLLEQLDVATTPEALQDALEKYAGLRAELTRAVDSGVLPAHDQAVHKSSLDQVAAALDQRRKAVEAHDVGRKKPGFAFKRKQEQPIVSRTSSCSEPAPAPECTPTTTSSTTDTPELNAAQTSQMSPGSVVTAASSSSNHVAISGLQGVSYKHEALHKRDTPISLDLSAVSDSLIDLGHCVSTVKSVQLRNVTHSIVVLPRVEGSVMVHDLASSILVVPLCHQFRMHTSNQVVVELATKRGSVVTIEACRQVVFVQQGSGTIKVQDFDDLIHSEQLKHGASPGGQAENKVNFNVVNRPGYSLAQRSKEVATSGSSMQASIAKILEELELAG